MKFFVHPDGSVMILPKVPTSKLKGIVKSRRRASLDEMETAIVEGAISPSSAPSTMIGLDTNVLVRYLTQDDAIQSRQALVLRLESLSS